MGVGGVRRTTELTYPNMTLEQIKQEMAKLRAPGGEVSEEECSKILRPIYEEERRAELDEAVRRAKQEPRQGLGAVNGSASELTLRACPFCGGGAELDTQQPYRNISTGNIRTAVAIYCTQCPASMSICREDVPDIEPEWLAGEWNRRADEGKTPND